MCLIYLTFVHNLYIVLFSYLFRTIYFVQRLCLNMLAGRDKNFTCNASVSYIASKLYRVCKKQHNVNYNFKKPNTLLFCAAYPYLISKNKLFYFISIFLFVICVLFVDCKGLK